MDLCADDLTEDYVFHIRLLAQNDAVSYKKFNSHEITRRQVSKRAVREFIRTSIHPLIQHLHSEEFLGKLEEDMDALEIYRRLHS